MTTITTTAVINGTALLPPDPEATRKIDEDVRAMLVSRGVTDKDRSAMPDIDVGVMLRSEEDTNLDVGAALLSDMASVEATDNDMTVGPDISIVCALTVPDEGISGDVVLTADNWEGLEVSIIER